MDAQLGFHRLVRRLPRHAIRKELAMEGQIDYFLRSHRPVLLGQKLRGNSKKLATAWFDHPDSR